MAWKRVAAKAAVVVLIATNVATVVWAGCFSTPKEQQPRSYCDTVSSIEYRYIPDPPLLCGFSINPFNGCYENTERLDEWVIYWTGPDCTGYIDESRSYRRNGIGTVRQDRAYVCGDTT